MACKPTSYLTVLMPWTRYLMLVSILCLSLLSMMCEQAVSTEAEKVMSTVIDELYTNSLSLALS